MKCLRCQAQNDKVIDSRRSGSNARTRRRRGCVSCGFRWTTIEVEVEGYEKLRDDMRKLQGLGFKLKDLIEEMTR